MLKKEGLRTQTAPALGVHPMGKTLGSVLNVTLVYDDGSVQPDLSDWTIELDTGALPAALWDPAKPNLKPSEPSAKLMDKCIVGVKRLKPPGGTLGPEAPLSQITWQGLDRATVTKRAVVQEIPTKTRARDVQTVVVGKKVEQKAIVDALATAGFTLNWQASQGFRELQAEPLSGAVA